jgi:galactokinase/galacturonokinase
VNAERADALRRRVCETWGVRADRVELAFAPYRICPLGAHSDHQHGPVLGAAIDACTLLAFAPQPSPRLELTSADFPGAVRVELGATPQLAGPAWGKYALGAAAVLRERLPATPTGVAGCVEGTLPGGGLSSSASLLIALLLALSHANGIAVTRVELARLARRAENAFVGVASGVLDPAAIAGARRDHLLAIDTAAVRWQAIPLPQPARARFLIAWSGVGRHLASTDFNRRVEECHAAARHLGRLTGMPGATRLGELPDAAFDAHGAALAPAERRRAAHFFGERQRVQEGIEAWREGRLDAFGALMNASCESSISNYETGSEELVRLQRILGSTPGVLGSRFAGAGFGGCALALVEEEACDAARERTLREFRSAFPALAERARAFATRSEDGARIL